MCADGFPFLSIFSSHFLTEECSVVLNENLKLTPNTNMFFKTVCF